MNKKKEEEYSVVYYTGERRKNGSKTIVAAITITATGEVYRGIAHCNPSDTFNEEIGKKIAEARARKQYFKAQANEALVQYELAKQIVARAKKIAEKKAFRHAREEKWLSAYVSKI